MRFVQILIISLACQHPFRGALVGGGRRKMRKNLQPRLRNFNFLIQKVDAKMRIDGDDITNDVITLGACLK